MKNLIMYTLITALFVGGSACTNLDEELQDSYTKDFDPSNQGVGNKDNVNKAQPADGLQGAFSKVLDGTAASGGFFAVQEGGTDEAVITQKGGDWYDGGLYIRMHHHEYTPQTWGINDVWNNSYGGIYQCNSILAESGTTTASAAQLKVLRAYFYWRLMDVFGNIPIVVLPNTSVAQSTRSQVFTFIEKELLDAVPDLPAGKQEYGRVSQGAAYALLARMYLNANIYTGTAQYDKAIAAADMVINSGVYSLSPNYSEVFDPHNVENVEHIFVAPFDEATGTGAQWPMMGLHYPSQLTYKFQSQPWNGFSTLEEFYNSYDDNDLRKAANFIQGPQYDYAATFGGEEKNEGHRILDLAFDKADLDGAPVNYTPFVNELFPNASRQGGARFGKFSFKVGQKNDADNDYPLLRYGEVLLNKAEALQRKNGFGDGTALTLVNQIRARAGATPFTSLTEGEMLAERGRELFVESQRRTDLIRFGVYGNAWWEKEVDPNAATHIIMAIPIEQMQSSASTANPLKQNPGY